MFSSLTLKAQLIISLVLAFIFAVTLVAFIYVKINALSELMSSAYKHTFTVSNAVNEANNNIISMHRYMKNVVISTTPEQTAIAIQQANFNEARIFDNLSVVREGYLGDIRQIDDVVDEINSAAVMRNKVIELAKLGRIDVAANITQQEGASHIKKIEEKMQVLLEFTDKKAKEYVALSQAKASSILFQILGFLLLIYFAGLSFGYSILQGIRHQIASLKTDSQAISMGDYSTPVANLGSNEIGELSHNLEQMRQSIRDAVKKIHDEKVFSSNLLDTAHAIILVLDTEGRVLQFNDYMEKLSGYSLADVKGADWFSLFLKSSEQQELKTVFLNTLDETSISWQLNSIISKSGRESLIEWHNKVLRDADNKVIGIISVGNDVTEKNKAEAQLKQSQKELQLALEAANLGLWDWRPQSEQLVTNDIFCTMLGYSPDTTLQTIEGLAILSHPDDIENSKQIMQPYLDGDDGLYRSERRMLAADGSWKWIQDIGKVIERDDDGKASRFIGVHVDITEQKINEQKLIESQQLAEAANTAKTEFLNNVSHELRTPLHGILGFAALGLSHPVLLSKEKSDKYFGNIKISADRLLVLINDLLDLSKLESGKMTLKCTQGNLMDITRSCLLEQQARLNSLNKNVQINPDSIPGVGVFDPFRISQVITNLLSNAIKFTPEGESIEISISETLLPDSENENTPALSFSIRDVGEGIPEAELELIFNKFEQSSNTLSKAEGTGLGLPICKEIISLHAGRVWAENHPDAGALFTFVIPVSGRCTE